MTDLFPLVTAFEMRCLCLKRFWIKIPDTISWTTFFTIIGPVMLDEFVEWHKEKNTMSWMDCVQTSSDASYNQIARGLKFKKDRARRRQCYWFNSLADPSDVPFSQVSSKIIPNTQWSFQHYWVLSRRHLFQ